MTLEEFKNSINLEEMAGHRSSLFGGIGLEQNSQKKFIKNLLILNIIIKYKYFQLL